MEYHYQAKTDVFVSFHLDKNFIQSKIIDPLKSCEKILIDLKLRFIKKIILKLKKCYHLLILSFFMR